MDEDATLAPDWLMVSAGRRQVDSRKIDCTDQTDKIVAVILKAISTLAIVVLHSDD